jgi:hypothetical protein
MTRRSPPNTTERAKPESASREAARKIVDELIAREPRLKAAQDAARASNGEEGSIAQESLRSFRQRLKDK